MIFERKIRVAARLLVAFLAGHGALQVLNIAAGIFLLRTLSMEGYAQFSLAFAFQTTAISLTNLGLTDSIIPLVGKHGDDPAVVGRLVRAAQALRNKLFLWVTPFVSLAFFLVVRSHGWSIQSQLLLILPILASLYLSVSVAGWSAPLLMRRRLYDFYLAQTLPAFGRLICYVLARLAHQLDAVVALVLNAVSILVNGILVRRRSRDLVQYPSQPDPATQREIVRCMLPMVPAATFTAFQPQVALFLVSIFGQTEQIAQMAALNRIAQLFLIFSTFNSVVIEPYVARLNSERLPVMYVRIVGAAVLLAGVATLVAFQYPQVLTWILGPDYRELNSVVGWVVLAAVLNCVANVMWVMNRGRRWLFWRGSVLEITCLIVFQTVYVLVFGVTNITSAAQFLLAASFAHLLTHAYIGVYGFSTERRGTAKYA